MSAVIKSIIQNSPAGHSKISEGDTLIAINNTKITDVLDYKFHSYDNRLTLTLRSAQGKIYKVKLKKNEGEDLGLVFDTFLLSPGRSCANKCIFCFIDQLPKDMRDTLYYKDDDTRLSFLMGNYVTLTNISEHEIERIITQRISPLNVSVHTMEPKLRSFMLGNKHGGKGIAVIKRLAQSGITLNCQIVCCPGINDGENLNYTMRELAALYPGVQSVSVVPVGLTRHREGLYPLTAFNSKTATSTIEMVTKFGSLCLENYGSRLFFCADELYLKAGLELPNHEFYEEYPQLENGVGMMRLFIHEFITALHNKRGLSFTPFTAVTGTAAFKYFEKLLYTAGEMYGRIEGDIVAVENEFFGSEITVAGLITGGDIIGRLQNSKIQGRLLIPSTMLKRDEPVFLDGMTVSDLETHLGVSVRIVEQDGSDFLCAITCN